MCGINGFNFESKPLIQNMNKAIQHRGPDGSGYNVDSNLSLGQVRLSIIDLSDAGHQPMFYSKKLGASNSKFNSNNISTSKYSIVFNGEIYNYKELKLILEGEGYKFSTKTDTEVILAAYDFWGEDCVNHFNGMWSFCINDIKKKILFCSRDRFGVKPFIYFFKDKKFIFSSELKGILTHTNLKINTLENISLDSIDFYFSAGFIPSPGSIFKDVFKLEAAHNLVFDLKKSEIKKIYRYYNLPKYSPIYNKKKLISEGKKIFKDATKLRMRSDVKVGAFLSGGIDSSSVVSEMSKLTDLKKVNTFSIGFKDKCDETKYINIVKDVLKPRHHHKYFLKEDFKAMMKKYSYVFDEPFADYSGFPTYEVSKMARNEVVVSLSGDGGDEVFGGYSMHLAGARMDLLRLIPKPIRFLGSKIPAKKNLNTFFSLYSLKHAFKLSNEKPYVFYAKSLSEDRIKTKSYINWTIKKLKESMKISGNNYGEMFRTFDTLYHTLPDKILTKVDKASMANSIEVRSPFMDYRFFNLAQNIPQKYKVDYKSTKKILKEIIGSDLPNEILYRKKQGFTPPLEKWILDKNISNKLPVFLDELNFLGLISKEVHSFYVNKALSENNSLYNEYKIRLLLFYEWFDYWVRGATK